MASFGASAICTWNSLSRRISGQAVDRNAGRERAEGVERETYCGVVDLPHDLPGVAVITNVTAPGQRFVGHAQAACGSPLAELAKVIDDAAAIGQGRWRDVRAHQHEIRAQLLQHIELALRAIEHALALGRGHPFEIAKRLEGYAREPRSRIIAPMTGTDSGEVSRSLSKISTCSKPASAIARSLVRSRPFTEMVAVQFCIRLLQVP